MGNIQGAPKSQPIEPTVRNHKREFKESNKM